MILIADGGSTKCDWLLLENNGTKSAQTETPGLNPYFLDAKKISDLLRNNEILFAKSYEIKKIFFYGAGCSSVAMCDVVKEGIREIFDSAEIIVDHDLLGSAMATYDDRPCISCIIGTGSNACFFDGNNISQAVPSLAYILGDEASGSYFGKILLREYFYKKLPEDLRGEFEKRYNPDKNEVLRRVYKEPNPNTYLASYMQFVLDHRGHMYVQNWADQGFREFLDIHVKSYPDWQSHPVHFVGSVAYFFKELLTNVCLQEGVQMGQIIQKPIEGLMNYHLRYRIA